MGELKYLTMCIKESMRLHCPIPFIQRETTSEITVDGITLPPKSIVSVQIYNVHHNPIVWEDPMVSRPCLVMKALYYNALSRYASVRWCTRSRAVAGKPRDAAVNFDRYRAEWAGSILFRSRSDTTEKCANRLLSSAKAGHVKSNDRSAAKRLMIVIKVKGAHVEFRLN